MNKSVSTPPAVLDCAWVIAHATVDDDVHFTGRCGMHAEGVPLGSIKKLAVCRSLADGSILLFYCDDAWHPLAAADHATVSEAKAQAERSYAGIDSKWHDLEVSDRDVGEYLDEHWPPCSFCGKRGFNVRLMIGTLTRICDQCIDRFHSMAHPEES